MAFTEQRRIEWGDCDNAGVVFYPNYFRWMDAAFHALCASAGYDQRSLRSAFGVFGTPLIDAQARFLTPATFGQTLEIAVVVSRWGTTSMALAYRFIRSETTILEGSEARVFVRRDDHGGFVKAPVPEAFRNALSDI